MIKLAISITLVWMEAKWLDCKNMFLNQNYFRRLGNLTMTRLERIHHIRNLLAVFKASKF